jgi:hypothetical protein
VGIRILIRVSIPEPHHRRVARDERREDLTMGSIDVRDAKLKPHEKPIWRKVFEAKVGQSLSVEAAAKHAWQAVKLWNEAGAFNEPDPKPGDQDEPDASGDYIQGFRKLRRWLGRFPFTVKNIDVPKLYDLTKQLDEGELDPDEFMTGLRSMFDPDADD